MNTFNRARIWVTRYWTIAAHKSVGPRAPTTTRWRTHGPDAQIPGERIVSSWSWLLRTSTDNCDPKSALVLQEPQTEAACTVIVGPSDSPSWILKHVTRALGARDGISFTHEGTSHFIKETLHRPKGQRPSACGEEGKFVSATSAYSGSCSRTELSNKSRNHSHQPAWPRTTGREPKRASTPT